MAKQRVLIIGHSFVHRLKAFVQKKRHMQAFSSLRGTADIYFHGVGGRTIAKFRKFDFNVVRQLVPDLDYYFGLFWIIFCDYFASSTISTYVSALSYVHKLGNFPDPTRNFLV